MNTAIYQKVKNGMSENVSIVLANTNQKNYGDVSISFMNYFVNDKKYPGVYVTTNKPFGVVKNALKKEKISTDTVIFIDAVTGLSKQQEGTGDCLFLENLHNLTDLSIAVSEAVGSLETKDKFIVIDSVSTLLVYNDAETVSRFIHLLVSKIRNWQIKGVVISMDKETADKLIPQIFKFFDITMDFGGK